MKDNYEEELNRMQLELEKKDRWIQSLLIQQKQYHQKFQMQNLSQPKSQASNNIMWLSIQSDNRFSVTNIPTDANVVSVPPLNVVTSSQSPISTTTCSATNITTDTTLRPINSPTTQVGIDSLIFQNSNDNNHNNSWQTIQSTIKSDNGSNNKKGNENNENPNPILPQISKPELQSNTKVSQESNNSITTISNKNEKISDPNVKKEDNNINSNVTNSADSSNGVKNSQSPVNNANQTGSKDTNKRNNSQTLIFNERSSNSKPIPTFLFDLDPTNVLEEWKKVTPECYVLYNPSLSRNIDVDSHMSFDHYS